MDPVKQYRERYRILWILLKKFLGFNDTKKNSWTLGSMELWGKYLVGRRNWVLLLDWYERERRITKNGVLWGSSMDHPARPGKIPGIRKSSKNHLEKKLLNSESDHGQTFLATALTWSCLPDAFLTRPPYHHRASSPRLTTTLPPRPCPTRLGILQHFTQVLSSIKSIAYRHAKNRLTMPPIRV